MSTTTNALKTWANIKDVGNKLATMFALINILSAKEDIHKELNPMMEEAAKEVTKIVKGFEDHEKALYALVDEVEQGE